MCCKEFCKLCTKCKKGWLQPWEPSVGPKFWIFFILDVGAYLGSFGMNIKTLENYATSQQWWYFGILLMAIVLPQVPINLFSFWWYRHDSPNRSVSCSDKAMHWLLLALPLRMCRMGVLACRLQNQADQNQIDQDQTDQNQADQSQTDQSQTDQSQADQNQADHNQADQDQADQDQADQDQPVFRDFHLAQADVSFLRLIAVYGGSGPQLVIRIYKMLKNGRIGGSLDGLFGVLTVVSLAKNAASYCSDSRTHRCDKQELSLASIILQALYRICFLASRVVALACLFSLGILPALSTCSCVFVLCFIWFIRMKTDFTESKEQELFFRLLMSYLHLFGMFNVKDDRAKYRYAFYYMLGFFIELLVFVAYIERNDDMLKLYAFPGVFLAGVLCHVLEHENFHPRGRWYKPRE